jgi:hypothetical protein
MKHKLGENKCVQKFACWSPSACSSPCYRFGPLKIWMLTVYWLKGSDEAVSCSMFLYSYAWLKVLWMLNGVICKESIGIFNHFYNQQWLKQPWILNRNLSSKNKELYILSVQEYVNGDVLKDCTIKWKFPCLKMFCRVSKSSVQARDIKTKSQ